MIRLLEFKLPIEAQGKKLEEKIRQALGISDMHPMEYKIIRRSLDARRSPESFHFVYTLDVTLSREEKIVKKLSSQKKVKWQLMEKTPSYQPPKVTRRPEKRPVVVGLGPCGLFCALLLSRSGLNPLIVERGCSVEKRTKDTLRFFKEHILDTESNVQFGEGGAGCYSDGKLNTLIKDPTRRGTFVMEEFIKAGAPSEILYSSKPHVGTDKLQIVVKNMREELLSLGAEIRFETKLTALHTEGGKVTGVTLTSRDGRETYEETDTVFLGIGHSARDTFRMLEKTGVFMEEKAFAMGVRIEHPREMIDKDQYRSYAGNPLLGSASYKLAYQASTGRSLYSFCMCPGGVVIASASEKETVVTNGMSYYARDGVNSNSALLVGVTPDDFAPYREKGGVLSGTLLQQELEHKAFLLGGSSYKAPVQTLGDFIKKKASTEHSFGEVQPTFTAGVTPENLWEILPSYMAETLAEGLAPQGPFGRKIHGFDREDAILTGVESRSSSPVRIVRDETGMSSVKGLYPMGEGAGYAGGITSAAIDGMKAAENYLNALHD